MSMIQDDGHIPGAVEKQIFETLAKIRKRDRSIYDSSQHFFADANEQAEEAPAEHETKAKKAKKPMYLKDVIAQQVGQLGMCAYGRKQRLATYVIVKFASKCSISPEHQQISLLQVPSVMFHLFAHVLYIRSSCS